jgi:site-specific DNA recombinase
LIRRRTCSSGTPTTTDIRVSDDKSRKARSPEQQEDECRYDIAVGGWIVADTYRDNDISASRYTRKSRPEGID